MDVAYILTAVQEIQINVLEIAKIKMTFSEDILVGPRPEIEMQSLGVIRTLFLFLAALFVQSTFIDQSTPSFVQLLLS